MAPGKPPKRRPTGTSHQKNSTKLRSVQDVVEYARAFAWDQTQALWSSSISRRFSHFILIIEVLLSVFIIEKVAYTEIDWTAYMEEVEGFLNGTLDYSKLEGGTGPLVYPAGFVYLYSILYFITDQGKNIHLAQYVFAGIYVAMLALVFRLYRKSQRLPPYLLVLMCFCAKRIHSIFMLRMFNDCVAMLLFFLSANLFVDNSWMWGCFAFSSAVSVKMNILLFAPGLLFLLLRQGFRTTFLGLAICGIWQLVLATPFLLVNPWAYLERSFDLKRQFFFKWTVNWRFIGEEMFLDRTFQIALLGLHLVMLGLLFVRIWLPLRRSAGRKDSVGVNAKLLILFTSNFVGVMFCRSLHYQFYVWYFHTLHFILWMIPLRTTLRLLLLGAIELSWNTYPSTSLSSFGLLLSHIVILATLLRLPDSEMIKSLELPQNEPLQKSRTSVLKAL